MYSLDLWAGFCFDSCSMRLCLLRSLIVLPASSMGARIRC
ncbi:hypothetical protein KSS87_004971 [Heliosperma pusillum]|nr:hypothetical protein KSS87_004971 [Heliosperma pusillum]